jgi:hypothetical protein
MKPFPMKRHSDREYVKFYRDPSTVGDATTQFEGHVQALIDAAVLADRAAREKAETEWQPEIIGAMADLRDKAIDDFRAGLCEPLFPLPSPIPWASRVAQAVLANLDDPVAVHEVARALAGMVRAGSVEHFELVERLGREGGTP